MPREAQCGYEQPSRRAWPHMKEERGATRLVVHAG